MSIQGEIDRLSAAKASIAASLQAMGIEPPEGTTLEQYAAQLAAIATAAPWLSIPGGGTMQMGESLGEGPYTIEVTEDGEGGDLSAEQVGYSNTGSGLEATNVQEAIDELAGKGGGEYLPLTGGTMQGDITIPADKAIKHGGSAAQIKMMPNGNIRIEAPLAEGAAAITVGTSGINLVNNTTQILQTSESGVALKANTDMTGHKIANLAAPSDPADAANKQYVDTSVEQALGSIGYSLIKEYTSPGSYTHTFDRKYTDVFVVVVGGGGGGGVGGMGKTGQQSGRGNGGGGGGGGEVIVAHFLDTDKIKNKSIIIGAGGNGGMAVSPNGGNEIVSQNNGLNGDSTSAFGLVALGGKGAKGENFGLPGNSVGASYDVPGSGGNYTQPGENGRYVDIIGIYMAGGGGGGANGENIPNKERGASGGATGGGDGGDGASQSANGTDGKNGSKGGGGGGAGGGCNYSSNQKRSGTGGRGGHGYVAIYGRG